MCRRGAGVGLQESWGCLRVMGRGRHVEFGGVDRGVARAGCYVVHEEFRIELIRGAVRSREEREVAVAEAVRAEEFLGEAGLLLLLVKVRFAKFVIVV